MNTYEQLDALAMGLSFVEAAGDVSLSQAAKEVRAKIQAGLPEPDQRKLEIAPLFASRRDGRAAPVMEKIRSAIRKRTVIDVQYRDQHAVLTRRRIQPLAIWAFTDGWLFAGWCELRDDFRAFRLDRLASVTETEDRFDDHPDRNLQAYLSFRMAPG